MKKKLTFFLLSLFLYSGCIIAQNRANLNTMAPRKLERLRDLIMEYTTQAIIDEHSNNAVHVGVGFITWHRTYIEGLEDYLDQTGNSDLVPLPYWDPQNKVPDEFFDPVAVKSPYVSLQNQFPNVPTSEFSNIDCSDFTDEADFVVHLIGKHNSAHNNVGGAMTAIMTSPAAAIFWPLHAWVDKVYNDYLVTCPPIPLSVNIAGPSSGYNSGTYTWTSSVSGGSSPYSYQWQYSYNGSTYYNMSTFASITNQLPYNQNLYLKLTVTDAVGDQSMDTHFVLNKSIIPGGGGGPFPFFAALQEGGLIQLYPNPASASVGMDIPDGIDISPVEFRIMGIHGQEIVSKPETRMGKAVFDTQELSPGIYMLVGVMGKERHLLGKFVKK